MKKLFYLIAAAMLCFATSACNSNVEASETDTTPVDTVEVDTVVVDTLVEIAE